MYAFVYTLLRGGDRRQLTRLKHLWECAEYELENPEYRRTQLKARLHERMRAAGMGV
jgi:hypothetical protein